MINKYNTAQAVILIIGFTNYLTAQVIGASDSNTSTATLVLIIIASLQVIASWHFKHQHTEARSLITPLQHAREAEILKLESFIGRILLAVSCFILFTLEVSIILNIFYN